MINAKDVKPEIFWPKKNGEAGKPHPVRHEPTTFWPKMTPMTELRGKYVISGLSSAYNKAPIFDHVVCRL